MKREVITTADGSKTIYIPEMDENYHSGHGALQEAKHVFIENGLKHFSGKPEITIFEMGFGTGLNALLSMIEADKTKIQIHYIGIEAFPIEKELVETISYQDLVDAKYRESFFKMHSSEWNQRIQLTENFSFLKIHDKIENYIPEAGSVDIIYFDAFGPRAQGAMWNIEILQKMYDVLKPNGIFVTYCAKGQVKRDLKALGFVVEALPGPPGKREMTLATKVAK